jgi:DSBA-like thioredoxin domain
MPGEPGTLPAVMTHTFAVTWDYRCPFARNAHDHVLTALEAGADWDVSFVPFVLGQGQVEPGAEPVWSAPGDDSGLLALQVAMAVHAIAPDHFLAVHRALFEHRHVNGGQLRSENDLRPVIERVGLDADAVFKEVSSGRPFDAVKDAHVSSARSHQVWGVPTFIVGDEAAFVRLMHRPDGDAAVARATVERVVDLLSWPDLNEFKHTSISR